MFLTKPKVNKPTAAKFKVMNSRYPPPSYMSFANQGFSKYKEMKNNFQQYRDSKPQRYMSSEYLAYGSVPGAAKRKIFV